jgi:hypothetical protein
MFIFWATDKRRSLFDGNRTWERKFVFILFYLKSFKLIKNKNKGWRKKTIGGGKRVSKIEWNQQEFETGLAHRYRWQTKSPFKLNWNHFRNLILKHWRLNSWICYGVIFNFETWRPAIPWTYCDHIVFSMSISERLKIVFWGWKQSQNATKAVRNVGRLGKFKPEHNYKFKTFTFHHW